MFERLLQACAAGASSLEENSQLRLLWMWLVTEAFLSHVKPMVSYGGFLKIKGSPSYHPCLFRMFHEINHPIHPAIGVASLMETPMKHVSIWTQEIFFLNSSKGTSLLRRLSGSEVSRVVLGFQSAPGLQVTQRSGLRSPKFEGKNHWKIEQDHWRSAERKVSKHEKRIAVHWCVLACFTLW